MSTGIPQANSKPQPGDVSTERFETDVVLRDGSLAHVRPVHSEDYILLADFVKSLSTETRCLRFLHAVNPDEAAKWLMPGAGQFALLATREGKEGNHRCNPKP